MAKLWNLFAPKALMFAQDRNHVDWPRLLNNGNTPLRETFFDSIERIESKDWLERGALKPIWNDAIAGIPGASDAVKVLVSMDHYLQVRAPGLFDKDLE